MSATPNQVQISGQIQLADLDALKAAGIGTVINNRPDGEAPDQPSSQEVEAKAEELGMKYFYVPVSPRGLTEDNLCLLYTSPSPRDATLSRMPSSA